MKHNNNVKINISKHDEDLVKNWNSVVGKKDNVWILGDFAWKNHGHFIKALNGKKFLIRGNHDKMPVNCFNLFSKIKGFSYHYSYFIHLYGKSVMLSHCPYETWFSSCHGSWHLYGHCHGRMPETLSLKFDVGVDVWNYTPVHWEVISAKMRLKEHMMKENLKNKTEHIPWNIEQIKEMNLKLMTQVGYCKPNEIEKSEDTDERSLVLEN